MKPLRWAVPAGILVAGGSALLVWWHSRPDAITRGRALNESAWDATYLDRGLSVPPQGPREGYWGSRLGKKLQDPVLTWREGRVHMPGLIETDDDGLQRFKSTEERPLKLLVLGGSVAFGAYASSTDRTYFSILGKALSADGFPVEITVAAAGGWKAVQSVKALEKFGPVIRPDIVMFVEGLNDLTNGGTAQGLYGQPVATVDGSPWTTSYHAGDFGDRIIAFVEHMDNAATISEKLGSTMIVVLQPALTEKSSLSAMEHELLRNSIAPMGPREIFVQSYQKMREGLNLLKHHRGVEWIDTSRAFDTERATTFADLWHFSDPGHEIFAKQILPTLKRVARLLTKASRTARSPAPLFLIQ